MANKRADALQTRAYTQKEAQQDDFCVYIGPTIVGAIQCGTIFMGSKKQVLASQELAFALQKYPLAADLLVRGEHLAESRQQVKQPGNLLHAKYQQLQRLVAEAARN